MQLEDYFFEDVRSICSPKQKREKSNVRILGTFSCVIDRCLTDLI